MQQTWGMLQHVPFYLLHVIKMSFSTRENVSGILLLQEEATNFSTMGELVQSDRTMMLFFATGITPSMVFPKPGTGSVYEIAVKDADGNYLDGGKNYKVTLPTPIPINNFWSFMINDAQTRWYFGD